MYGMRAAMRFLVVAVAALVLYARLDHGGTGTFSHVMPVAHDAGQPMARANEKSAGQQPAAADPTTLSPYDQVIERESGSTTPEGRRALATAMLAPTYERYFSVA